MRLFNKRNGAVALVLASMMAVTACGAPSIDHLVGNSYEVKEGVVTTTKTYTNSKGESVELTKEEYVSSEEILEEKPVVQYAKPEKGDVVAKIKIKGYGTITVKFFPDHAPLAVENFVQHVKDGYYDGLTFHRIIDDFMIQGGDPTGTGSGGDSIWKDDKGEYIPFEDEYSKYLMPIRGALCMANSGENTNGSQFFIVQTNSYQIADVMNLRNAGVDDDLIDYYKENGGAGWLYEAHTVFGQVVDGYDVLDKVAGVKTNASNGKPNEDVIIEKIELSTY